MRFCGIDIGTKNFACYVEDVSDTEIAALKSLSDAWKVCADFDDTMKKIFATGARVKLRLEDLTGSDDIELRKNLFAFLASLLDVFSDCDVIRIEQQFIHHIETGFAMNLDMIKLAECTISWFLIHFPNKDVKFMQAKQKTELLKCPFRAKAERKKWASKLLVDYFELKHDEEMIRLFNEIKQQKNKRPNEAVRLKMLNDKFPNQMLCSYPLFKKFILDKQKLDDLGDAVAIVNAEKINRYVKM